LKKKPTKDKILELIRLVDRNFKVSLFDVFFRGDMAFPFIAFLVLLFFIEVYLFSAPTHETIVVALSFLAVAIAFSSLMFGFMEKNIEKVNFKRLGKDWENNEKPLLRALINMKAKNPKTDLEQIYNLNKSMFSKEKLLETLYE